MRSTLALEHRGACARGRCDCVPGLATNSIFLSLLSKKILFRGHGKPMTPNQGGENTALVCSSQQLPHLSLGPFKGFLSWHDASTSPRALPLNTHIFYTFGMPTGGTELANRPAVSLLIVGGTKPPFPWLPRREGARFRRISSVSRFLNLLLE